MIGDTWMTTTTVWPGCAARIRSRARRTRRVTVSNDSPAGGATAGSASHRASSSGQRCLTSSKVWPSQSPKSVSIRPSSIADRRGRAGRRSAARSAGSAQRRADQRVHRAELGDPAGGQPRPARAPSRGQRQVRPSGEAARHRVRGDPVPDQHEPGRRVLSAAPRRWCRPAAAPRGIRAGRDGRPVGRIGPADRRRAGQPAGRGPGPVAGRGGGVHRLVGQPVGVAVLGPRDPARSSIRSNRPASSPAWRASGRIAGCLTCQRPDICSMTSLESICTRTSAAPSSAAAVSPAIRPRYSATLLVAMPMAALRSASTAPVRRPAPPRRSRPGPGCPASRRRPRPPPEGRPPVGPRLTARTRRSAPGSAGSCRSAARPRPWPPGPSDSSEPASSSRQPSQRRCRSIAAPTPPLASRTLS